MENEQTGAGRDGRTCLARTNSQARTGIGKKVLTPEGLATIIYPVDVDPYSAESAGYTYIHTYIYTYIHTYNADPMLLLIPLGN